MSQVNTAMFEQFGNCGYMLKPRALWDATHPLFGRFNPLSKVQQIFENHFSISEPPAGLKIFPNTLGSRPPELFRVSSLNLPYELSIYNILTFQCLP